MKARNTAKESRADRQKLATVPDAKIDTSDIPELDEDFFREAKLRMLKAKQLVSLRLDSDVLDWLKRQGKGYQTKINAIFRAYVQAHRR
ncbi:MAG: 3-oxoacyl-ACP synthase [Planctomycetes bacterium RBG_13_60_9]|nr:MAG: 3-oxoacyl-ACP synthase [Planctomycetes bacterium RBG_13_60_9]